MVKYEQPKVPENLDQLNLNPIQRYIQKGSLEKQDYVYLFIFVLAYIALRPAIKKGAAWLLAPKDFHEGQEAQKEHAQNKAKAKIGANAIRGGNDEPEELEDTVSKDVKASGVESGAVGQVLNRKTKGQDSNKSEVDKLIDWDDEPARGKQEGDKSDVMAWLDKWDK